MAVAVVVAAAFTWVGAGPARAATPAVTDDTTPDDVTRMT
jgi:hypothetical protein